MGRVKEHCFFLSYLSIFFYFFLGYYVALCIINDNVFIVFLVFFWYILYFKGIKFPQLEK